MPYEVFLGRTPEKVYGKLTAKLRKAVGSLHTRWVMPLRRLKYTR